MASELPDVGALIPLETQHISPECRVNRAPVAAWWDAVEQLRQVYDAQVQRRPGATVSVAIYVSESESSA